MAEQPLTSEQNRPKYKGRIVDSVREQHRLQKRADREVIRQFLQSFRRKP